MSVIKFMLSLIIILLVVLIGFFFHIQFSQTSSYKGPASNHFDGKYFFNIYSYEKKSFYDVFRWMRTRKKTSWPNHVINSAHPNLNKPLENQIKITFVNHATVLIQSKDVTILTDPIWSYRASPFSWYGPYRVREPGVKFTDLPKIDVVVISHNHYDHLDLVTLKQINDAFHPEFLVPLGIKQLLIRHHIQNVTEFDWWQTKKINTVTFTFLPAQHWSARWVNDRFKTLWGSWGMSLKNKKIFFAGDVGYSNIFLDIKEKWGKPDIAFLPIGAYEPRWFMKSNHLNPEEAVKAHFDLKATHSIPIHFGTFQMSDEGFDQPIIDLEISLKNYQLSNKSFSVMNVGETRVF